MSTQTKQRKSASSTVGKLVPRRVQFDWSQTPLHWIPDQPFASHFINEINLLLPAGEFWFCRLYNQALPYIKDDKLREDVQAFMRQEAMHARAHGGAIAEYLDSHKLDSQGYTKRVDWLFETALADAPFGRRLPKSAEKSWLVFRLGIVAAVEHMTCVLGKYVLENRSWDAQGADPVLLDLLRWHGAEEIEHRCVAFDLYRHLGGNYLSRYYLAAITFPMVFGLWVAGAAHLMRQDPQFKSKRPSILRPWIWLEWRRAAKAGQLPGLGWLALRELPYLTPWYHPRGEASTEAALAYLERSPAARTVTA